MGFLIELWCFMRVRKKFWLMPMLIMMVVFGGLVMLTKGSAVAPFVYTLFSAGADACPRNFRFLPRQRSRGGRDGHIVAAAQEERFTRKKHDSRFPKHAIGYCLRRAVQVERPRARRVLRQAVGEIRATAGNLSRLCAARLPLLPDGDADLAERETVPEERANGE